MYALQVYLVMINAAKGPRGKPITNERKDAYGASRKRNSVRRPSSYHDDRPNGPSIKQKYEAAKSRCLKVMTETEFNEIYAFFKSDEGDAAISSLTKTAINKKFGSVKTDAVFAVEQLVFFDKIHGNQKDLGGAGAGTPKTSGFLSQRSSGVSGSTGRIPTQLQPKVRTTTPKVGLPHSASSRTTTPKVGLRTDTPSSRAARQTHVRPGTNSGKNASTSSSVSRTKTPLSASGSPVKVPFGSPAKDKSRERSGSGGDKCSNSGSSSGTSSGGSICPSISSKQTGSSDSSGSSYSSSSSNITATTHGPQDWYVKPASASASRSRKS